MALNKRRIVSLAIILLFVFSFHVIFDMSWPVNDMRPLELFVGPPGSIIVKHADVYLSMPDRYARFVFNFTFTKLYINYTFAIWLPLPVMVVASPRVTLLGWSQFTWGSVGSSFPSNRAKLDWILVNSSQRVWPVTYSPVNSSYWRDHALGDEITIECHFLSEVVSSRSYTDKMLSLPIFSSDLSSAEIAGEAATLISSGGISPIYWENSSHLSLSIELDSGYEFGSRTFPAVSNPGVNGSRRVAGFDLTSEMQRSASTQSGFVVQLDAVSASAQEQKDLLVPVTDLALGALFGYILGLRKKSA